MGRVCFISLDNLYLVPYLKKYLSFVGKYDVIYWNRSNVEEKSGAENIYAFHCASGNKFQKLLGYVRFSFFAAEILKKNDYSRVVILHTPLAVLIGKLLCTQYSGRYLLDIRDYSYEKYRWYREWEKKLVNHSGLNVISSKGYLSFLPSGEYISVHNDNPIEPSLIELSRRNFSTRKRPIVISNIGLIRFHQQNRKLILAFRNDPRFQLRFIGKGADELADFCREQKVENVQLTGYFVPEKSVEYFMQSDVISNLYGNHIPLLDYALSNKLYYAAKLCKPILVCPDTYMQKASVGFGYTMDLDSQHVADNFYSYYTAIDKEKLQRACDDFLVEVFRENAIFDQKVTNFLNSDAFTSELV